MSSALFHGCSSLGLLGMANDFMAHLLIAWHLRAGAKGPYVRSTDCKMGASQKKKDTARPPNMTQPCAPVGKIECPPSQTSGLAVWHVAGAGFSR